MIYTEYIRSVYLTNCVVLAVCHIASAVSIHVCRLGKAPMLGICYSLNKLLYGFMLCTVREKVFLK